MWRSSRCFGDTSHYFLFRLIFKPRGICGGRPHAAFNNFVLVKIQRHFPPPCVCVTASAVAVCLPFLSSLSPFSLSLSLAAAQQPLALQIQPLISDLGGCLGEEGYWLRVCERVCLCVCMCVWIAVYVGHLRASWHCRGGGFTTGPLLPRYYRGSRFPGKGPWW